MKILKTLLHLLPLTGLATSLSAVIVTESWNYAKADGTVVNAANDFDGGIGWAGAEWGLTTSDAGYQLKTGGDLSYAATGYANVSDGNFVQGRGGRGSTAHHNFRDVAASDFTGTVFASALFQTSSGTIQETAFFFLDGDAGGQVGVADVGGSLSVSYGSNLVNAGLSTQTTIGSLTSATTSLVIFKLETDYSGSNDRITAWLNPTDVTSEAQATVTSASVVVDPGADIWGTSLGRTFGVYGRVGASVDDLRLAYGADGFSQLVAVPEPSTYGLILGGLAACWAFLRRRR